MVGKQVAVLRKLGSDILGPNNLPRAELLSALSYGSKEQMITALKLIQNAGNSTAEMHLGEAVKECMGHQDPEICTAAVNAMGTMGMTIFRYSDDMATYLLKHPNAKCRAATVDALAKLGEEATQDVRSSVAHCLNDADPQVRTVALRAVAAMRVSSGRIDIVRKLLKDPVSDVRAAAIETLSHCVSVSLEAESICTQDFLAEELASLLASSRTRHSALVAIQQLGSKAPGSSAGEVVSALADKDAVTRQAAAVAVGVLAGPVMEQPSVVAKLSELLLHDSAGVRAAAAHAIGNMGAAASELAPSVAVLLDDIEEDTSYTSASMGTSVRRPAPQMRFPVCAALTALATIGDTTQISAVASRLSSEHWEIRMTACEALGHFGEAARGEVTTLMSAVEDASYPVRAMACYALGEMNSAEAVSTLVEAFEDKAHTVRVYAVTAMGRLGLKAEEYSHDAFKLVNDPVPQVRGAAVVCLASLGEAGKHYSGVIAGLLYDGDADLRVSSLQALALLGDHGAAFADEIFDRYYNDPVSTVRQTAGAALAAVGLMGEAMEELPAIEISQAPVLEQGAPAAVQFDGLGLYYAEIQEKKKELQSSGRWVEGIF